MINITGILQNFRLRKFEKKKIFKIQMVPCFYNRKPFLLRGLYKTILIIIINYFENKKIGVVQFSFR